MAEQHARTFEQWAAFQITGNAATAFIALPLVGLETCAVGCFQGGNNTCLQIQKVVVSGGHGSRHAVPPGRARQPMSERYCCPSTGVCATAAQAVAWASRAGP